MDRTRGDVRHRGTEDTVQVDPVVGPESLVFHRDDRVLQDLGYLGERDVLAVDGAELADLIAARVIDRGALRQRLELTHGVALIRDALGEDRGAGQQRGEAGAERDPAGHDRDEELPDRRCEPHEASRITQGWAVFALAAPASPDEGVRAPR